MRTPSIFLNLFLCAMLVGCVSKIDSTISMPQDYEDNNTHTLDAKYDQVWKATVDAVGHSFFVIENVQKDSGIITLSFSANTPKDFIDCGKIVETGKLHGREYNNSYDGAESNTMRIFTPQDGSLPFQAIRTLTLSGKMNVLVKKVTEVSTSITINTRYVVELTYTGSQPVQIGYHVIYRPVSMSTAMNFTNKEAGSFSGHSGLVCKSKMKVETDLFNLIQSQLGVSKKK